MRSLEIQEKLLNLILQKFRDVKHSENDRLDTTLGTDWAVLHPTCAGLECDTP